MALLKYTGDMEFERLTSSNMGSKFQLHKFKTAWIPIKSVPKIYYMYARNFTAKRCNNPRTVYAKGPKIIEFQETKN